MLVDKVVVVAQRERQNNKQERRIEGLAPEQVMTELKAKDPKTPVCICRFLTDKSRIAKAIYLAEIN